MQVTLLHRFFRLSTKPVDKSVDGAGTRGAEAHGGALRDSLDTFWSRKKRFPYQWLAIRILQAFSKRPSKAACLDRPVTLCKTAAGRGPAQSPRRLVQCASPSTAAHISTKTSSQTYSQPMHQYFSRVIGQPCR